MYPEADQIKQIIDQVQRIVIIQADNPDADSLGSALALEHILGELGKEPYLYCALDVPSYLQYMSGWDRVNKELTSQFDASIIVDASTLTLLEKLKDSGQIGWLSTKPCIVIDHHEVVESPINFAKVSLNDPKRSSAGELIYAIAKQLNWPLKPQTEEYIMTAILGDTQGLSNDLASPATYRIMADMLEHGVSRPLLEEKRREFSKMPESIYRYKAKLIQKSQFAAEGRIAYVSVTQDEISTYSPLYNPAPLIQGDMLQTKGVSIAIVFKEYDDGKMTAAIRANSDAPIAASLAEFMGGGGHKFASGFKAVNVKDFEAKKHECIAKAEELLKEAASAAV